MKSLVAANLSGKWYLTSFQLVYCGLKWNWGKNATGWITYDKEGPVKVEIKAERSAFPSVAGLIFNNQLVYGGNYEIQDKLIIHHLDYSSKKSWLGKDQVREVLALDDNRLVLQGGSKSFHYQLAWSKS